MNEAGKDLKFGSVLKNIRETRGLSIRAFSNKCELSAVYISDLEACNRKATMNVIEHVSSKIPLTDEEFSAMKKAFVRDRMDIPKEVINYLVDNDLIESLESLSRTDQNGSHIKQLALNLNMKK